MLCELKDDEYDDVNCECGAYDCEQDVVCEWRVSTLVHGIYRLDVDRL